MADQPPPPCPVCGRTEVDHERVYVIGGHTIRLRFASCLHPRPEPPEDFQGVLSDNG